jgi:hypothetical protein
MDVGTIALGASCIGAGLFLLGYYRATFISRHDSPIHVFDYHIGFWGGRFMCLFFCIPGVIFLYEGFTIDPELNLRRLQNQLELSHLRSERTRLATQAIPDSPDLIQAKAELARLQALPADPPHPSGTPLDKVGYILLSFFGLGVSFFLGSILENFFKDKGYAVLILCFFVLLLAYLMTNYLLSAAHSRAL